ncbi:hypothetical protein EC991_009374 [Linnemannia zychae]|nr:hypothetical protein EC991_009374 [Linnemannia zychae]
MPPRSCCVEHLDISHDIVPDIPTQISVLRRVIDFAWVKLAVAINEVAQEDLRRGADGCLKRAVVEEVRQQCGSGVEVTKAVDTIPDFFKNVSGPLIIFDNTFLVKGIA